MKTILRAALASLALMAGACGSSSTTNPPAAPGVPGAPTGVQGTGGNGQVQLQWVKPRDDGGAAITGYTVTVSPGGSTVAVGASTTASVTGLTNGTSYTFTVKATNSTGTGPASAASTPVVPANVPSAPSAVVATVQGAGDLKVSWSPSDPRGSALTGYTVTSNAGALRQVTLEHSVEFQNLHAGVLYTFTVVASNGQGDSAPVTASAKTPSVPSAPTGLIGVAYDRQLMLYWQAPASTGGLPISDYAVTVFPGGSPVHVGTAQFVSISGLTNNTSYTYTVTATNPVGPGAASDVSQPFTPVPPISTTSTIPVDGGSMTTASGVFFAADAGTFVVGTAVTVDETAAVAPDSGVLQASMMYTLNADHPDLAPVVLSVPVNSGVSQGSLYWEMGLSDGGTAFQQVPSVFDGGSVTATVPTLSRGFIGVP